MSESDLFLRPVVSADLPIFFAHQQDADALWMAAFTAENPADRAAFDAHWQRILASPTVHIRTIICGETVAGHVLSYEDEGRPEVSYWLGRDHWGRGCATRALGQFLQTVNRTRPIFARVATDNIGSRRVLEKCGFRTIENMRGFANARSAEIDELLLRCDVAPAPTTP